MNKKRCFALISILVIALAGALYYFYFSKKLAPSAKTGQSIATQTPAKTAGTGNPSTAIEKVDFLKYLAEKYESPDPLKGDGTCPMGSTELQDFSNNQKSVYYGFIAGNEVEAAVMNYRTCANGTGGGNSEVFITDAAGKLVNITPDEKNLSQEDKKKFFNGFGGHGYFGINGSNLIFTYPIYKENDSNANPTGGIATITFKWDGSRFLYDTIAIDPSNN